MHRKTQSQINQFIFNLNNEDLSKANANLKSILESKIQERFAQAEKQIVSKKKTNK